MTNLDPGDIKKLSITITDEAGAKADPDTLALEVRKPTGEVVTFTWPGGDVEKDSTGEFHCKVELDEAGAWEYRWRSTGVQVSERGTLYVGVDTFTEDPFPDEGFTVADVWARSATLKSRYPQGAGDGELVLLVAATAPLVGSLTGRDIGGVEGEAVPIGMHEMALLAIAMKTDSLDSAIGTTDAREDAIERSRLRSIQAGSWSESYFGPGEAAQAKQLDLDPTLASILWALCTDEKKSEWIELWEGREKGFSMVESFDYSRRPGGY